MTLSQQLKSISHHAYCLIGDASVTAELISVLEKTHKIKTHGNPDFSSLTYEIFTIDDARQLKSSAEMRPVISDRKFFIVTMNGITVEAQNALLKLLEEPPEYAHFFLIIPSAHLLLPTVRSRMALIERDAHVSDDLLKVARNVVTSPAAKRLEIIKKLMDEISKDKRPKQDAIDLIDAVEEIIYAQGVTKKNAQALEAIELARKYMNDRSPSLKMLLEYVALSI
jgi:DNA polymerase III delta prime subunit